MVGILPLVLVSAHSAGALGAQRQQVDATCAAVTLDKEAIVNPKTIVCPIEYEENSNYTWYSGFDPLNVGAYDVLTAAEYIPPQ